MALPTSYLTSTKHLGAILNAIQGAQAPKTFTNSFLLQLEFKSSADRLVIAVLKALKFLDAQGVPTPRYHQFLDQSQGKAVLAAGIREAYADLFQINTKANEMTAADVKNKLRTLTQGAASSEVIDKMATTFRALCQHADFGAPVKEAGKAPEDRLSEVPAGAPHGRVQGETKKSGALAMGGLVYNIQIVLPDSRDQAVYDALFRSLREHLL